MQLTEQQKNTFSKAIKKFGTAKQIIKAIEELSEMQKELCKFLLHPNDVDYNNIADEMADVIIINYQLNLIFDELNPLFKDLVLHRIEFKNRRVADLIY